ncbi:hypothetical protein MKX03_024495 [Papaver bracteatum]|nr:hypothetical protein MKX03_024495 [Papaver bracteatum]
MKMGSNFSMKIVMDLIFSLLLLGRFFFAEAVGRINVWNQHQIYVKYALISQDCNTCCKSTLGYPQGGFTMLGICCFQKDSMKV